MMLSNSGKYLYPNSNYTGYDTILGFLSYFTIHVAFFGKLPAEVNGGALALEHEDLIESRGHGKTR